MERQSPNQSIQQEDTKGDISQIVSFLIYFKRENF